MGDPTLDGPCANQRQVDVGAGDAREPVVAAVDDLLLVTDLDGEVLHGDHVIVTADPATRAMKFEIVRHAQPVASKRR